MPNLNLMSVPAQKIWAETIGKEEATRLQWHKKRKEGDIYGETGQFEVFKKQLERHAIKPLTVKQLPPIDPKKRCRKSAKSFMQSIEETSLKRADALLAKSNERQVVDMFPVEKKVRSSLYDGISRDKKGRWNYLRQRVDIIPEKKYQFPLCSSWEYGWQLENAIPKDQIKKPEYGSISLIRDTFYTRNGIPTYHSSRYIKKDDARADILMADV